MIAECLQNKNKMHIFIIRALRLQWLRQWNDGIYAQLHRPSTSSESSWSHSIGPRYTKWFPGNCRRHSGKLDSYAFAIPSIAWRVSRHVHSPQYIFLLLYSLSISRWSLRIYEWGDVVIVLIAEFSRLSLFTWRENRLCEWWKREKGHRQLAQHSVWIRLMKHLHTIVWHKSHRISLWWAFCICDLVSIEYLPQRISANVVHANFNGECLFNDGARAQLNLTNANVSMFIWAAKHRIPKTVFKYWIIRVSLITINKQCWLTRFSRIWRVISTICEIIKQFYRQTKGRKYIVRKGIKASIHAVHLTKTLIRYSMMIGIRTRWRRPTREKKCFSFLSVDDWMTTIVYHSISRRRRSLEYSTSENWVYGTENVWCGIVDAISAHVSIEYE